MPIITLLPKTGAAPSGPVSHGFAEGSVRTAGTCEGRAWNGDTATGTLGLAGTAEGFVEGETDLD